MTADVSSGLPVRRGHFLLESGYHTDLWFTLDALFVDPGKSAPRVRELAARLRSYDVSAVCGPLLGGAFLAQALSAELGASFYFTEPDRPQSDDGLFRVRYHLPHDLRGRLRGKRVAVVDDVVSAGSSVRATIAALSLEGASIVAVGALLVLGDTARSHFADPDIRIPIESLEERDFVLWEPGDCPLCREGTPLEDPRETSLSSSEEAEKDPRALVEEFYSAIWNRHDKSKIPQLLTEDFAFRGSLGPSHVGHDGFASYVDAVHESLGSYRCDILDLVVEDEKAFARMRFSGIHRGELLGHAPTGKPVEWRGTALFTFRNGRIADLWVLGDLDGLRQSLARRAR